MEGADAGNFCTWVPGSERSGQEITDQPKKGEYCVKQSQIMTFGFLGILGILTAASILIPERGFSETENRYLQKKPEFTIESLLDGSYGTDYETYLSDQFPVRNQWIGLKVMAERLAGKKDVNEVYFGKDDYLIEKFDTEDLETEELFKNLESLKRFTETMETMLGQDHIRLMLVPGASQILDEKLPWMASPYDQAKVNEWLSDEAGSEFVVPVESALKEHKDEEIYYRTDHHWTTLGAYYGYCAWAESVGLTPWQKEMFETEIVSRNFLGTVHSKLNVNWMPDHITLYHPKEPTAYQVYYDGADTPGEMYQRKALETKDQYPVFLDGNHGLTRIVNEKLSEGSGEDELEKRKLLVIKDSFANSFAPFAANHFGEVQMIDLRYFNGNVVKWIEEQEITDVLVLYQIPGFAKERTVSKLGWQN